MQLQNSILKTIVYFDLFDFPLTAEEIKDYLYQYKNPLHIKEVKGTLEQMIEAGLIENIKGYYVLNERGQIIETRKNRKFIAEKLWNRTKLYGQYMRAVPFVEMIAVCNNLAYDNVNEQSDIDLLIVIKPGRMWLARLIITLILQFYGVRRHGNKTASRFCLSFFVTTNKLNMGELQINPEDPYLAYWTTLVSPIYGQSVYETFKAENQPWLDNYGLKFNTDTQKHAYVDSTNHVKKFYEWLLGGHIGNAIESLLKKTFKKKTIARAKQLGPEANILISDDILKFHNHDRRQEYYEKWQNKTNALASE